MPATWEQLVADWATDNGIGLSGAILKLSGTPGWFEAKQRHSDGATEKVVRHLLDAALAATANKLQENDNAVQEPGTAGVHVRQASEDRQAV